MDSNLNLIKRSILKSDSRIDIWINFLNLIEAKNILELGVAKGFFAKNILEKCISIEKYFLLDPWRYIESWNKPANKTNELFETFFAEAIKNTEFKKNKRIVLRGKTTEVIDEINDFELDFAYIDGDHTLKGITIDLIKVYPKIANGGWIAGDDFSPTIWQHKSNFEPTLVFPYAIYFAEAVGAKIYALPYLQFFIQKTNANSFEFIDLTRNYKDLSLVNQFK